MKNYIDRELQVERGSSKYGSKLMNDSMGGGIADDKKPQDFDSIELERGILVEREHTDSIEIATEIAMDHLTEDKDYYEKLSKMEK